MTWRIQAGDARAVLAGWPAGSVQCVCTSPPYYLLRDYNTPGQIGLESSLDAYIAALVEVFRAVRRVLRPDGTCWINIGDSYSNAGRAGSRGAKRGAGKPGWTAGGALGDKQLLLVPARVALALQADGWYLRSAIVWNKPNCLSGGAIVYARTQKGEMPMMIKDLVRLRPETVQLWNGQRWTQVVSWLENPRPERPLELTLRNGQRISCTPDHLWPTQRGNVRADALVCGDVIQTCQLPEPPEPERPEMLPAEDIGWFVGLYLAEGSRSGDCIQISGHRDETARWHRVQRLVARYGGSCKRYEHGQAGADFHIFSKVLSAVLEMYVAGRVAQDKHLSMVCWRRDNAFLREVLDGYLNGDGHWDAANARWRIGFTRNYYLEADLRTLCARLGYSLRLNLSTAKIGERVYPTFKGELREARSTHYNTRQDGEVVSIGASKARKFWDISVADDPHLFALASGVLTHNCMPESVRDRPTKSYEMVYLFSKQGRYFYDAAAIAEPCSEDTHGGLAPNQHKRWEIGLASQHTTLGVTQGNETRNARDVFTIPTESFEGAHFAVMPTELARRCILAGSRPGDVVGDPFTGAGTVGVVALRHGRGFWGAELNPDYVTMAEQRIVADAPLFNRQEGAA